MSEYFELVLFDDGMQAAEDKLESVKSIFKPLFTEDFMLRYCKNDAGGFEEIKYIQYEDKNFTEYEINIPNFKMYRDTFKEQMLSFSAYIDVCFEEIPSLLFATGMYELTYDQIAHLEDIHKINYDTFKKIPIVFFRKNQMKKYGYDSAFVEYKNTVCCFNKDGTQHIFDEKDN